MLKKAIRSIMVLLAFLIGVSSAILLNYFMAKIIHIDPVFWGIIDGILSIFIIASTYILIRPDLRKILDNEPIFGNVSVRLYSFFLIYGIGAFLLFMSISAFITAYWMK